MNHAWRTTLAAVSLLCLPVLAIAADSGANALALGRPAPARETKMKSVDGRDVSIAEVAGKKGTLVVFMCNHCPWVKAWQERIATIGNAAVTRGIGVIAINSNDPEIYPEDSFDGMQVRAKLLKLDFPYVMDQTSDVARAFGATRTPEVYLFDARGRLVYHGTVDDNAHEEKAVQKRWMQDAVEAVGSGRRVPLAETKAFGCGIRLREKAAAGI